MATMPVNTASSSSNMEMGMSQRKMPPSIMMATPASSRQDCLKFKVICTHLKNKIYNSEKTVGHMRQPSPVRNIAVMAPYGTSLGSVAVSPADTPDVEPTIPPYIMAERKLSSLILLAAEELLSLPQWI